MAEPLEHMHKGVRYTCIGEGLLKDGHPYDAHIEKFLPPRGNTNQTVEKKLVAWWKAQCAFRGLNQTGAIADLQLRLREAKATMLPELKAIQTQLNREYKKKNKTTSTWGSLKTVEQKAKADPERFLTEAFPPGATGRPANLDIVVVKLEDHPALADAAENLGLERVSVDAPWISGKKPSPDRWLIIGRHRDAVWNQMQDIQRETFRSKQNIPKQTTKVQQSKEPKKPVKPALLSKAQQQTSSPQMKQTTKRSASVGNQVGRESRPYAITPKAEKSPEKSRLKSKSPEKPASEPRTKQTARRSAPFGTGFGAALPPGRLQMLRFSESSAMFTDEPEVVKGAWDVFGLYKISCPEFERQWPQDKELSLTIVCKEINGKCQMYAEFDFGAIEGLMRFEKPNPVPKSTESLSSKRKREQNLDEEGDIQMYGYPSHNDEATAGNVSTYNDTVFNLTTKDVPTSRRPIWRYRWRGRETGENEIQLDSDKAVETILFEKGGKLSGMFTCNIAERCAFTGIKMKTMPPVFQGGPDDINRSWHDLRESMWDYERRGRWGGGGIRSYPDD